MRLELAFLLIVTVSLGSLSPAVGAPPDIILIVLDDAGIEQFDFYNWRGPGGDYADTPFLTTKIETNLEGALFTNAWSNPYCSPTRASFHTGEFAFRTGIGSLINDTDTYGLDVDDADLLPKLLASTAGSTTAYETGLFGKWHLGTSTDQDEYSAPNSAGYSHYAALFLHKQGSQSPTGAPYFTFTITRHATPDPDPWTSSKTKGTVGQGGVLVPFIAFGDTVDDGVEIAHSVNLNDLYATILDFAGKASLIPNDVDSVSLKGIMDGSESTKPHAFNYTETFFPNFEPGTGFGPCQGQQAVQEDPGEYATYTLKYIRKIDGSEALYDLDADPDEDDNLLSPPPSASRLAALESQIDSVLDSDLAEICALSSKKGIGETCSVDSDCCSNDCSNATSECVCPIQ